MSLRQFSWSYLDRYIHRLMSNSPNLKANTEFDIQGSPVLSIKPSVPPARYKDLPYITFCKADFSNTNIKIYKTIDDGSQLGLRNGPLRYVFSRQFS